MANFDYTTNFLINGSTGFESFQGVKRENILELPIDFACVNDGAGLAADDTLEIWRSDGGVGGLNAAVFVETVTGTVTNGLDIYWALTGSPTTHDNELFTAIDTAALGWIAPTYDFVNGTGTSPNIAGTPPFPYFLTDTSGDLRLIIENQGSNATINSGVIRVFIELTNFVPQNISPVGVSTG